MFFQNYAVLIQQAQTNLVGLFNPDDYPPLDDVKKKFAFNLAVKPVPESGDFRLDIPTTDLEEIKQSFEEQQAQKLADAMRAPWERLHTMLIAMSAKLAKGKDVNASMRWHDSFISNPLELCQLLTAMNITNDPKLEEARKQLELTMLGINIESLKEDVNAREDLKTKVDSILGKFSW
jgi:biotin synthase-related radical SAM superfamily protein